MAATNSLPFSLPRVRPDDLRPASLPSMDQATLDAAALIMDAVRSGGEAVLADYAARLDGNPGRLWYGPEDFQAALAGLESSRCGALERCAGRVEDFARAQLACLSALDTAVPGGRAGHHLVPLENAGCYAPGGRFPLPTSVIMTAVPARVAGVGHVAVACPRPERSILAACALAGADLLLAAGGAQAIAALAYGCGTLEPRDIIVGPGNRWVSAAKMLAQARTRTDAPAGPSELLIVGDGSADPAALAWDLAAQAEHDPDARACLAVSSEDYARRVEAELALVLDSLDADATASAANARSALASSWCLVDPDMGVLMDAAARVAPEHLELATADPDSLLPLVRHAGAVFMGPASAEAFGDYGAGPNHVLPTAGRARSHGGLSVFDFLRVRSWLRLDAPAALAGDVAALASMEGLRAHRGSAEVRLEG